MRFQGYDLIECRTFLSKFIGLMFSKRKNLVFILNKESRLNAAVHMLFVFYPINVYWLDKNKKIVDFKKNLRPFKFAVPKKKAKYIIEISTF